MGIPTHFKLAAEGPHHYEIHDERDNSRFNVAKSALNLNMHANLSKIKKLSDGTSKEDFLATERRLRGDAPAQDQDLGLMADVPDVSQNPTTPPPMMASMQPTSLMEPTRANAAALGQPLAPEVNPQGLATIPTQASTPPPQGAATPSAPLNPLDEMNKAFELEKTGITGEAAAKKAGFTQQEAAYQDHLDDLEDSKADHDKRLGDLNDRSDALFKAAQQEVNPNKYWGDKSTGSKIGISLGILLGGIGQGLSHSTHNMAWDALQDNINRDIQSQKDNIGQKNNLYHMNLAKTRNEQEAWNQTKADMLSITAAKINQTAAQIGTPLAEAEKQKLLAKVGMEQAAVHQQMAGAGIAKQAMTQGIPVEGLPYLNEKQRENMVRLPNGLMADAGNSKNRELYNENTAAGMSLMSEMNRLKQLNTLGTKMSPQDRAAADALLHHIVVGLNDYAKSHRISESDIGFQTGQLSDPRSFMNVFYKNPNAATDQLEKSIGDSMKIIGQQYVPAIANMNAKKEQAQKGIDFQKR